MALDLTALKTAHASHVSAAQTLLDAATKHADAAKAAAESEAATQAEINGVTAEIEAHTQALASFNAANPA